MCKVSSQINKDYSNKLSREYIILSKIYKAIDCNDYKTVNSLTKSLIEIQYKKGDIERANILSQGMYNT
jgi:hypothetical protein